MYYRFVIRPLGLFYGRWGHLRPVKAARDAYVRVAHFLAWRRLVSWTVKTGLRCFMWNKLGIDTRSEWKPCTESYQLPEFLWPISRYVTFRF